MPEASINGFRMHFEDEGSGPPILFHHGFAGSHESWERVVPLLKDRYRCVTFDCRGAGESEHASGGYTIKQFGLDVLGLADHLGIDRFVFVGLSMGGAVGFQLGVDASARLERLILVAPAPSDGLPAEATAALQTWVELKDRAGLAAGIRAGFARPVSDDFLSRRVEHLLSVAPEHITEGGRALVSLRLKNRLGEVQTPTLVVAGAADSLLTENLRDFEQLGNATLHVFSRTGHQVPLDVPEGLAEAVDDFIRHGVVTAETLRA